MSFNPFDEKPGKIDNIFMDWNEMNSKPYDKNEADPYTKTRIILMNGTEFESVWFTHQFSRHCDNNDIRRDLAYIRRNEQQQQKKIASLKPLNETQLETTIGYEQLAVDLTAFMAQRAVDKNVKNALDFALLEDFDHLYRYANLLENDAGIHAEKLVGSYTEIMPARPTISQHRCPCDSIKNYINAKQSDMLTVLDTNIITAAEQQTMNYYMNLGSVYSNEAGRKLYSEIGMIEEQHVSQYGSLIDPKSTFLECNLMHEYVECYLYYSMFEDETDANVKKVWERCLEQEIVHLHHAANLLKTYEKKEWNSVIPRGAFTALIKLHSNKDYVRKILKNTVCLTANREQYENVNKLPKDCDFFKYQSCVNGANPNSVASHNVIKDYIAKHGCDYRYEDKPNPIAELQDRKVDNTNVGRV